MTSSVQEARAALGKRLREIRRRAGLSGRDLARLEGFHESKVSKYEYGRLHVTDAVVRAYCRHCDAGNQLEDLIATLHNIDNAHVEWKQVLGAGMRHRQQQTLGLEARASSIRNWEPSIVSGLLQTSDYASAIMRNVIDFYRIPDDLDEAVAKRMDRQRILYQSGKQFHILLAEQSLYTSIGDDQVMIGQLERLSSVSGMSRVALGIVPRAAEGRVIVDNFFLFDNRMVKVEGHTAGITITQPREIALYGRAFDTLAALAVTGVRARDLIRKALETRTES